jgi:hypothetical protein
MNELSREFLSEEYFFEAWFGIFKNRFTFAVPYRK